MADGDTYTLPRGKRKGAIRIAIDKAAGTTHELVAAVASSKIRVLKLEILVEGAGSTANVVEESNSTVLYGPVECITGSTATRITLDEDDAVETTTINKALQLTLSSSLAISGSIVYVEIK